MDIRHSQNLPRPFFFERSRGSSRPNVFSFDAGHARAATCSAKCSSGGRGLFSQFREAFDAPPSCMSRIVAGLERAKQPENVGIALPPLLDHYESRRKSSILSLKVI
jgi:hypothetical protein